MTSALSQRFFPPPPLGDVTPLRQTQCRPDSSLEAWQQHGHNLMEPSGITSDIHAQILAICDACSIVCCRTRHLPDVPFEKRLRVGFVVRHIRRFERFLLTRYIAGGTFSRSSVWTELWLPLNYALASLKLVVDRRQDLSAPQLFSSISAYASARRSAGLCNPMPAWLRHTQEERFDRSENQFAKPATTRRRRG